MPIKTEKSRTLKDRLSHLSHAKVVALLKPGGQKWLREGEMFEVNIDTDINLDDDNLYLQFSDAKLHIYVDDGKRNLLKWECSCQQKVCAHIGAAFSTLLQEKTPLGLAKEPPEIQAVIPLNDAELRQNALNERRERATKEKMRVKSLSPKVLWSDYLVTNSTTGNTYRVALRGWLSNESFCSCPDYRKNTLGTCKHILHALAKVEKRFTPNTRKRAYVQKEIALHLCYGKSLELRFLLPNKASPAIEKLVAPLRDRAITDAHYLLNCLQSIERCGETVLIYPDAEEYIEQLLFRERVHSITTAIRLDPESHPLRNALLKVNLLPYQLDGIAFSVNAGRAILADEMGLGKTIQGIGVAELLAREADIERVLVITPASVKSQWRSEINKFCNRESQIVVGDIKSRAKQYQTPVFFTLCNYEQVLHDAHLIEQQPWDLIILDEGQRIKNWEAKTSKIIKTLRSRFALVLTGTPLENRLDDLYSIMEFVDDRRLGPGFDFYNRHRILDEKGKILGYQNLNELKNKMSPVLLRRTRASVNQQLPKRSTKVIRILPTAAQVDLHAGFQLTISRILQKRYLTEIDLLRLQKALLMCRMTANSTYLVDKQAPGHSSKLTELEQLLKDLAQEDDRKILLFSEWTTMLNLIEPLIKNLGWDFVRLDGSVPQKKREALVQQFQNNSSCRIFMTTNAGATGLNLQAANTIINVDLPWNPALLEQRIARAYRMGQKQAVQVYLLVTAETLEENLLATLSAKHELALAALDPDTSIDQVALRSGIEELKKRLEILLGAKPEIADDEVEKQQELIKIAHQQRLEETGGHLLSAAFGFISELLPKVDETPETQKMTQLFKQQLSSFMHKTDDGKLQLRLNIPSEQTVNIFAQTLAQLVQMGQGLSAK